MNYDGDVLMLVDEYEVVMYRFDVCAGEYLVEDTLTRGDPVQSASLTHQQLCMATTSGEVVVEGYKWDKPVACRDTDFRIGDAQSFPMP